MSDKVSQLVNHVKQLIQEGQRQTIDCIREIDNQIDSKENQIRQLFGQNIESVMTHYLKYHQTLFHHRRLENDCEQFAKHIQKTQKLNSYDQSQIQKSQKSLDYLKSVKLKLNQYRNHIRLAKKAALNIKEQKYNNAIKIINQYRKKEPKNDTPLKTVLPILQKKVEEHLRKLLDSFWQENKTRMLDIGKNCFGKMSSNYQQKLNIYQIFFGKGVGRSSLNNRMSSFRCTILARETSSRILKQGDEQGQYLQKIMVRVNVEMSTLKKVKAMVVELNNQGIFNEMLRNSMRDYLGYIAENYSCEREQHFKQILAVLIGFLLIRRQVCAFFDLRMDQRVFLNQIYQLLSRELKNIAAIQKNTQTIKSLKQNLVIFHRILQLLDLNDNNEKYNQIILQLVKNYSQRNLQAFDALSAAQIQQDNLTHFSTKDEEKEQLVKQILDLGDQQFRFTCYVVFILDYFLKTYQDVLTLLEDSDNGQNLLSESISDLYQRILSIYGSQLLGKDQHYQIIQGQVNVIHIHRCYRYIAGQLQTSFGIVGSSKLSQKYEQLMVKLTRNILQVIRNKLQKLMEDYNSTTGKEANDGHHDFVEWTLQFVWHIIQFMRAVDCPSHQQISIEAMREMCELYWQYLKGLKQFNLILIYNLDLDLSFIYQFCRSKFAGNMAVLDKFKSLRQFYALMLTNNIQDLLQPQKRSISYPNLSLELVVMMLKKYVQVKTNSGKIRQLKKKDIQNVLKKLLQSVK